MNDEISKSMEKFEQYSVTQQLAYETCQNCVKKSIHNSKLRCVFVQRRISQRAPSAQIDMGPESIRKKSKTAFLRSELVPQCTVHSHTAAQNHNKQNVGCLIKVQIKSIESTQISCKCRLNRLCYNDLRNICVYFIQTFEPYHWK